MEERINLMLSNLLGWEAVDEWWREPHDAFNGLPPGEVEDLMEVYDYVDMVHKASKTWD